MSDLVEKVAKVLWWRFEGSTPERAEEVWRQSEEVRGAEREEMREIARAVVEIVAAECGPVGKEVW